MYSGSAGALLPRCNAVCFSARLRVRVLVDVYVCARGGGERVSGCVCNWAGCKRGPIASLSPFFSLSLSVVSQLGGERAHGEPLFEQQWKTNKTASARSSSSLGNTRDCCSHSLSSSWTHTHTHTRHTYTYAVLSLKFAYTCKCI